MSTKNGNKKQIAFVVYHGFSLLERVAAQHVWVSATMMSAYETVVVGPTTDFIVSCRDGLVEYKWSRGTIAF